MAKRHNKKKVKGKKRKVKTTKKQFRQTVPKNLPSGVASIGQFTQPVPPKLRPIGTYIPEYRTAWSNPLAEKAAPVISKSWLAQQQPPPANTQADLMKAMKEGLGMGTWASNITSQLEKQQAKMNTLSEIAKKKRFRFRAASRSSDSDSWESVRALESNLSSSGSDERAGSGFRRSQSDSDRSFAEREARDADERPYESGFSMSDRDRRTPSPSPARSIISGIGSLAPSPRPTPTLAGAGAGAEARAGAGAETLKKTDYFELDTDELADYSPDSENPIKATTSKGSGRTKKKKRETGSTRELPISFFQWLEKEYEPRKEIKLKKTSSGNYDLRNSEVKKARRKYGRLAEANELPKFYQDAYDKWFRRHMRGFD